MGMTNDPSASMVPEGDERWEALARYLAGEAPPDEARALEQWLAQEPQRRALLNAVARSLQAVTFETPADLDVEAALASVRTRMHEPQVLPFERPALSPERRVSRWSTIGLRVAAAILVVLGGNMLWHAQWRRPGVGPMARSIESTIGHTDTIPLPDGSRVLLSPASRLRIAAGYGEKGREVTLEGEALFEVVHRADLPFLVHAGPATIRDLGTTFAVRVNEQSGVRVSVTAGSVRLQAKAQPADSGVMLAAGDRGILRPDGRAEAQRSGVKPEDLAWTRGQLIYDNAPLEQVVDDVRRWYGVQLRFRGAAFEGRHLTTNLTGETVQEVLNVIALSLGGRIERKGDTAIVSLKESGAGIQ